MTNNNTSIVPASPEIKPADSVALKSSRGTVIGTRSYFGTKSASELKAALKAQGFKGSELKDKVNDALANEGAQRLIFATAWLQSRAQEGYIPDLGDAKKNTGLLRLVKPKLSAKPMSRTDALAALGLTEELLATLKLANGE